MKKIIQLFIKNYALYLTEAWGLGTFMISASLFTILLEHPDLKLHDLIPSNFIRRLIIGIAMGATAIGIIYSSWGKKSGAHMNPAITLTMLLLKKISIGNAVFYCCFQIIGGTLGVYLVYLIFPAYISHPSVNYVVTVPGKQGVLGALIGEASISFLLMFITLFTSNTKSLKNSTGLVSGFLIMNFVAFESPFSGFSMNPARTIASAWPANIWTAWALYLFIPPLAMVVAASLYTLFWKDGTFHSLKFFVHCKKSGS